MDWEPHVVRQGETLSVLAWGVGGDPNTVWRHEKNALLAQLRKNPQILLPTDIIYLPKKLLVWRTLSIGETNVFVVEVPDVSICVMLPEFAGASYTALVDGTAINPGSVAGDGTVSLCIPIDTRIVRLTFDAPEGSLDLMVGHLDPADTPTGRSQRLENLGIPLPAPGDDEDGHALRRAISIFQLGNGIVPTGEFDAATQAALELAHGS